MIGGDSITSYLSRFMDSPGFDRLSGLRSDSICPYLYYNISPYVFTIANGGWFSWIKRTRCPTDRGRPVIKNPALKKTNRQFINEVVVRCPNPDSNIIAGIGPWEKGAVTVRILHCEGSCAFHHRAGQSTFLEKEAGDRSLRYSRLFPQALLEAMAAIPMEEAVRRFYEGRAGSITPAEIINPCRYHNRPISYNFRSLLPDNCCPHVFQQIYPHILAVMQNAAVDRKISIQRPENGGDLTIKIEKKLLKRPWLIKQLMNNLYLLSGRLLHPTERLDYTLTVEVLSGEAGTGFLMQKGRRYTVNLRNRNFLCPAGFHAAYPYLLLAAADVRMEWANASPSALIPCPDCAGTIYSIKSHQDP